MEFVSEVLIVNTDTIVNTLSVTRHTTTVCVDVRKDRKTLTGKIGNIHRSRFSFVTVKTCDVTMERTNTNLVAVKNIWLKLLFQSWFSVYLVLHRLNRWIISLTKYIIASLLSLMFFINLNFIYNVYPAWIFSVHCVKEVDWKSTLKSEFQSYVFDDVRKKS